MNNITAGFELEGATSVRQWVEHSFAAEHPVPPPSVLSGAEALAVLHINDHLGLSASPARVEQHASGDWIVSIGPPQTRDEALRDVERVARNHVSTKVLLYGGSLRAAHQRTRA